VVVVCGESHLEANFSDDTGKEGIKFKKTQAGSGGSDLSEKSFLKFLEDFFGTDNFQRLVSNHYWLYKLAKHWHTFATNVHSSVGLDLDLHEIVTSFFQKTTQHPGINLQNLVSTFNSSHSSHLSLTSNLLRLPPELVKSFYGSSILNVLNFVEKFLKDINPQYMFLVGGFALNPFLQTAVIQKFSGNTKVAFVEEPQNAVLLGAALYNPAGYKKKLPYTYGIKYFKYPWDPMKDPLAKRRETDNGVRCKDCFDLLIKKGDFVGEETVFYRTFVPLQNPKQGSPPKIKFFFV